MGNATAQISAKLEDVIYAAGVNLVYEAPSRSLLKQTENHLEKYLCNSKLSLLQQ